MVDGTRQADDLDKTGPLWWSKTWKHNFFFLASELFIEGKGVQFLQTNGENNRKKQRD